MASRRKSKSTKGMPRLPRCSVCGNMMGVVTTAHDVHGAFTGRCVTCEKLSPQDREKKVRERERLAQQRKSRRVTFVTGGAPG